MFQVYPPKMYGPINPPKMSSAKKLSQELVSSKRCPADRGGWFDS